jgi:DNA-binding transcriptional ArsR family regulator
MDPTLDSPARVLRDLSLEALQALTWAETSWTAERAARVDALLRARVLDLLRDRPDAAALSAAAHALGTVARPSVRAALDGLDLAYASRWRALADLVSDRAVQVRDGPGLADAVRQRKHASAVLRAVQGAPLSQAELAAQIGLDPSALSRLLALMEDAGLVKRAARGNEKVVSLAEPPASGRIGRGVWSGA